ncbi:MAG: dihydroorotase [Burkholderiales bacterium]|nr:dihydroorotase [Burkholderiales bacterium]GIK87523.1 MAG: dihydroorotase [Betaproteobacteria bacterium]
MPTRLTLTRPDDWHLHLRDGAALAAVVGATARVFARAIVMPNLRPPVTTVAAAAEYRARILAALPPGAAFEPLMTLYLTDRTSVQEIASARRSGIVHAVKYYPAGATTHSEAGVTSIDRAYPALAAMEREGLVLCVHGEVTDADVDIYDRERVFVDTLLARIVRDFPALRVVLEHVTTREAVQFVTDAGPGVAATITPQHLLWSRNAMLAGGVRPHLYCLPILKRETHRRALVDAATSGSPKFFLGTDSAPHERATKEHACGCAGCFSAPVALPLYAEAFEDAGALDRLEGFASFFGADFYRLPRNGGTVTLERVAEEVPADLAYGGGRIVPLRGGERVRWRVAAPA